MGGNALNVVGTLLFTFSRSFGVMFLGRFIMGLGAGIAFMGPELYACEVRASQACLHNTHVVRSVYTSNLPGCNLGAFAQNICHFAPRVVQMSPPHVRGLTSSFGELFINFGILIGYLSGCVPYHGIDYLYLYVLSSMSVFA